MTASIPSGNDRLATGGSAGEDHARMHGRTLDVWENVLAHGAAGDGVTNDTAAIQAAIAATPVRGTVFFPPGHTFLISLDSIVFTTQNVMAKGATFKVSQTGAGVAIGVGNGTQEFYNYTYHLGLVTYTGTGSGTSWQAGSVGVKAWGFYTSTIYVDQVYGFEKGLWMTAGNNGVADSAYSQVFAIDLVSNKVNLYIDGGTGTGFNNEIVYLIGRLGHGGGYGTNIANCHNIKIVHSSSNRPNMHKVWGPSVEGNSHANGQTIVTDGSSCEFLGCRFEATNPGVVFNANADRNLVENAYGSGSALAISDSGNYNTVIQRAQYQAIENIGGAAGILRLINTSSSAHPVIYIKEPGDDLHDGSTTDYRVALGPDYLLMKSASHANPRFQVVSATGELNWGDGTAAVDTQLRRSSTAGLLENASGGFIARGATGHFYCAAGKGLVNIATGNDGSLVVGDGTLGYGAYLQRNLNDAHPVIYINQGHASATGPQIVLQRAGTANAQIRSGTGTPESAVTANVGSLFLRTDGGASTTLYIKESGTGNTGWVAK